MKTLPTIALLVVTACITSSAANQPIDERKVASNSAKTVAIVLAGGKQMNVSFIDFTLFTNVDKNIDIPNWGLDKKMLEQTGKMLAGKYEVVSAEYLPELERIAYATAKDRGIRAEMGELVLQPFVERAIQKKPVDLVLFILPGGQPSLRVMSARPSIPMNSVVVPLTITLFDTKTKHEIFGMRTSGACDPIEFDFKAADLNVEAERNRETLERLWMSCYAKHLTNFAKGAGL